jgi:hypothetical protein
VLVTPLAPWHMYALSSDICKLGPPLLCSTINTLYYARGNMSLLDLF